MLDGVRCGSDGMSTSWCTILYIIVSLASSLRRCRVSHPSWCIMEVTLLNHLILWLSRSVYGAQVDAAYSRVGLTKVLYAMSFAVIGAFLTFLLRKA